MGLESVVDRFDDLPQWLEEALSRKGFLSLAAGRSSLMPASARWLRIGCRSSSCRPSTSVRDGGEQVGVGVEHPEQNFAFVGLGAGQRNATGSPDRRIPGAGAVPRRSASATRSTHTRPTRPDRSVSRSHASARTRPESSRPPTHRRCTARCTQPDARSPRAASASPRARACCSPIVLADKETARADGCSHSAATWPRR